jgi:FolB domain-containing protein
VGEDAKYGRVEAVSDSISITGLRLTGYHGVFEHEKIDGQVFIVDLTIELNTQHAGQSDDLADTLDYSVVVDEVAARVTGQSVDLIETLAEDISRIVLGHPQPQAVTVTVHKPDAPVGHPVSDIAVTIRREK